MAHTPLDQHILDLLDQNGEMRTRDIYDTRPETSKNTIRSRIGKLKTAGKVEKVQNGIYRLAPVDPQTAFYEKRRKLSSEVRFVEDNRETINKLLNTYDEVLKLFQRWILQNIACSEIDFEQQLVFLENFKWLTLIADKLIKRWHLVHIGYETNTRQAQEDTKAKVEERQKAALEDAPIEDTVMVVGMYDPEAKVLIDAIPSSVEQKTPEETEEVP